MAAGNTETHQISALAVEVATDGDIVIGADMTLKVRVSCAHRCDLRGRTLEIRDRDTVVADGIELTEFDGETNETGAFALKAPIEPGEYSWLAVFPAQQQNGAVHEATSAPFSFTVEPHPVAITVWGVPSAVVAGEEFRVAVGIKCIAGCELTDTVFEIHDHEGERVATGAVGSEPWPGTTALFYAEVDLTAPDGEGSHRWEARTPASAGRPPHRGAARTFGLTVVRPPDHRVTVEAIDRDKRTPIAGLHVILHPFRAVTDERGVAELSVPQGAYELHVSGRRYFPFHTAVEVTEDLSMQAELEWEIRPEKIR